MPFAAVDYRLRLFVNRDGPNFPSWLDGHVTSPRAADSFSHVCWCQFIVCIVVGFALVGSSIGQFYIWVTLFNTGGCRLEKLVTRQRPFSARKVVIPQRTPASSSASMGSSGSPMLFCFLVSTPATFPCD